jgi:hypothetical protein
MGGVLKPHVGGSAGDPDRDKGKELIGSWPLVQVRLTEQSYHRRWGPIPLGLAGNTFRVR